MKSVKPVKSVKFYEAKLAFGDYYYSKVIIHYELLYHIDSITDPGRSRSSAVGYTLHLTSGEGLVLRSRAAVNERTSGM